MSISKKTIEDVRAANDIVDVVGSYVQLKRGGSGYKALCPFHKEKTPSFTVNPQRQIYHCFGCGAGGDVFRFMMEHQGLDFIGAVTLLGQRAGIHIEVEERPEDDGPSRESLLHIHHELAALFHRGLLESDLAEHARKYLSSRNLEGEIGERFQIGYAPDRWEPVLSWCEKKGYTIDQLEAAGVIGRGDKKDDVYGRFRDRLMFPICDELGRVIGFSGRLLNDNHKTAKYLNTPETRIFHKGRVLYALDKARQDILDQRRAVLCEGQIDVIRCHQHGVTNVIAPQGTALTEIHGKIIARYADEVILVFDADKAGQEATLRAAEVLLGAGLSVRVVRLPEGLDPDTLITQDGVEAFRTHLDEAASIVDFHADILGEREDLSSEVGIMRSAKAMLQIISRSSVAVQQDAMFRKAAERLNLSEQALQRDLRRIRNPRPAGNSDDAPGKRPEYPRDELALAQHVFRHAELTAELRHYLPTSQVSDASLRTIFEALLTRTDDASWDLVNALPGQDDELVRLAAMVQAPAEPELDKGVSPESKLHELIIRLRRRAMERRHAEIKHLIDQGDESEDLAAERLQLKVWINTLRQGWEKAQPILDVAD